MNLQLSIKEIGARISAIRKLKGISQKELAVFLKIPRSSIAQIESGKRNLSVNELMRLAEVLTFSLDKFLSTEFTLPENANDLEGTHPAEAGVRISVPAFNAGKLRNIVLYLLEHCAGKPNVGETVLYKLLYFSDFNYYEKYEEHLSGSVYRKLPFGPVPQNLDTILQQMIEKGRLKRIKTSYHGYPQTRYIPLEKANLLEMGAAEKETIDLVIEQFSDWSASAISEYSHKDMPWKASEEGEIIDYELVFYREAPFSARTYLEEPEHP